MSNTPKREYTDEEVKEARADLEAKVRGIMEDMTKMAQERITKVELSGVALVEDHLNNGCNFATPKDFVVALCKEGMHQYRRPNPSRVMNRVIENYYLHM